MARCHTHESHGQRWLLGTGAREGICPQREHRALRWYPLGMYPLRAHCSRGLGTLYAQTDQAEQARAALSTALAMYQGMEMTFWLPQRRQCWRRWQGNDREKRSLALLRY